MTTIGELVTVIKGRKPDLIRADAQPGDRRLLQIDDLRPNPTLKFSPATPRDVVAKETDVIVAWDGANAGTSSHGLNGTVGSTLSVLRPLDEEAVHTPFLGHFVASQSAHLRRTCKGATVPHIDPVVLKSLSLQLPPVREQQHIAAILGLADICRTKRRQILARFDALVRSVFHGMFDGSSAVTRVEDVSTRIRTGPFGSQLLHGELVDSGVAVLGLDNVVSNEFRWVDRRYITAEKYELLKRYTVRPGDVLISIMGTTGRCVVVPDDIPTAINTKHICAVTVDHGLLNPTFLRATFLWHPESRSHLRRQTKGSIMAGLNMSIIRTMPIPVPPLALQETFAARVEQINAQRAAVQRALAADDELFASLQSRAFRGEL